jgi:hypothetical protein
MKMWIQRGTVVVSVSGSRKLILPNKANFSSSSRNQDTSIRHDALFSEEPSMSATSSSPKMKMCATRPLLPGQRKLKVFFAEQTQFFPKLNKRRHLYPL